MGRSVPDVTDNADARTGYLIRVNGEVYISGGTSASVPLWAGLIARINQQLAKTTNATHVGYINPLLYKGLGRSSAFYDIISSTNDPLGNLDGAYIARPGWDACTGWESPNGTSLTLILAGQESFEAINESTNRRSPLNSSPINKDAQEQEERISLEMALEEKRNN